MRNKELKKYYKIDRDDGINLTEIGYFNLIKGVLFKTNGFDEYANEKGIIINPAHVCTTTFKYTFNLPYKGYIKHNYGVKLNTRIQIIKDDSVTLVIDKTPIYVYLNWRERFFLSRRFNNLLVQKKDFLMWFTNVVVALGATIAGFLVVFCK